MDDYEDEVQWLSGQGDNKWDPLRATTGAPLTEITVKSCVVPPGLFDVCSPTTSAKEDALRGKWIRVDRDLNKQIGIYYLYIFYRESSLFLGGCWGSSRRSPLSGRLLPGSSAPVITNLTVLQHAPVDNDLSPGYAATESSLPPTMLISILSQRHLGRSLRVAADRCLAAHGSSLPPLQAHAAIRSLGSTQNELQRDGGRTGAYH